MACCALAADRKKNQKTFVRLHSAPLPTVMIAMYVPPSACPADKGDYFTRLSILNKQDYVRWFSGELMIGTKTFDPSLRPAGHHEVSSQHVYSTKAWTAMVQGYASAEPLPQGWCQECCCLVQACNSGICASCTHDSCTVV